MSGGDIPGVRHQAPSVCACHLPRHHPPSLAVTFPALASTVGCLSPHLSVAPPYQAHEFAVIWETGPARGVGLLLSVPGEEAVTTSSRVAAGLIHSRGLYPAARHARRGACGSSPMALNLSLKWKNFARLWAGPAPLSRIPACFSFYLRTRSDSVSTMPRGNPVPRREIGPRRHQTRFGFPQGAERRPPGYTRNFHACPGVSADPASSCGPVGSSPA